MSLRELLGALRRAGWELHRHGGNHDVWRSGSWQVHVPRHADGMGIGTMRSIARQALRARAEEE